MIGHHRGLDREGADRNAILTLEAGLLDLDFSASDWYAEGPNRGFRATGLVESYKPLAGNDPFRYDGTVGRGDVAGWFKRFLGCTDVVIALKETKKLVETVRLVDAAEQIGDCLAGFQLQDNGPHLWLPNESRRLPELPSFDPAYDDAEAVPMTAALVEEAIRAFRKSFAGALAQLGRIYGSEPGIRFGVVGYRR